MGGTCKEHLFDDFGIDHFFDCSHLIDELKTFAKDGLLSLRKCSDYLKRSGSNVVPEKIRLLQKLAGNTDQLKLKDLENYQKYYELDISNFVYSSECIPLKDKQSYLENLLQVFSLIKLQPQTKAR